MPAGGQEVNQTTTSQSQLQEARRRARLATIEVPHHFQRALPAEFQGFEPGFRLNWMKHCSVQELLLQHLSSLVAEYPRQLRQRTELPYLRLLWTNHAMRLEINVTMRDMARPVHPRSQLVKAAQWAVGRSATGFQEDGFNGTDFGMLVWCIVGA